MEKIEKKAMKITHRAMFNAAAEDYDFGAIWLVEDLCQKDLDDTLAEYEAAVEEYNLARGARNKDLATIKMYEKYIEYLKKNIIYQDFMKG